MQRFFNKIAGMKFGKLTAVCIVGNRKDGSLLWKCKCECGGEIVTTSTKLKQGKIVDCGCGHFARASRASKTHGMSKTRIYKAWVNMRERCYNPKDISYKNYGDKGIKVCDRWLHSFENFYEDMNDGYADDLTLDRIDGNKGYSKDNCRWATYIEQTNNVCTNKIIEVDGIEDTVANTCRRYNANYDRVLNRLAIGWNPDEAVKTPRLDPLDNLTYNR